MLWRAYARLAIEPLSPASLPEAIIRSISVILVFCSALAAVNASYAAAISTGPLIVQPIIDRMRASIPGNTRPEAHLAEDDRGIVPDDLPLDHMLLQLRRSPAAEQRLDALINQLYDRRSPNYHHWLSAQEFGNEFGPARADVHKVAVWLRSHGFKLNSIEASGMVIDFSGTAGWVRETFSSPIHYLSANGKGHIANVQDPEIPVALVPVVAGIVSLSDFRPAGTFRGRSHAAFVQSTARASVIVPADLATIYDLKPLWAAGVTGKGQTVAVIEDSDLYSSVDWERFRSALGLNKYGAGSLRTIHPNSSTSHGNCADPHANGDSEEAAVDAEWASAAAPAATIEIASCRNAATTSGLLIALQNLVNSADPPAAINISFSECESNLGTTANAAYYAAYQQAAAEGISVFVSAGDEGAAACDIGRWMSFHGVAVNGLASTPYDVAVGGTDFADRTGRFKSHYWLSSPMDSAEPKALSYVPEIPWNDSCASWLGGEAAANVPVGFGIGGFCNTIVGSNFWNADAGSGGPSSCAYGAPDISSAATVSGTCSGHAKPSWQKGIPGNADDGVRDLPDVSLFAGDGGWGYYHAACWSDAHGGGAPCSGAPSAWTGGGGTALASSYLAGIQALIDQNKGGRQGNPDPIYYELAKVQFGDAVGSRCENEKGEPRCIFHDVLFGSTSVNCTAAVNRESSGQSGKTVDCLTAGGQIGVLARPSVLGKWPAYEAVPGWDFATGIGSIDAAQLAKAWPDPVTTPTPPARASRVR